MRRCATTILREPRPADDETLTALRNDVDLQLQLLARPRPNSVSRVRDWVERISSDPGAVFFVIAESTGADPSAGTAIGFLQLRDLDLVSGHGRLGIAVRAESQRRGHARRALDLAGSYGREVFGLRKIVLEVRADNDAARGLYRSAGFADVGVLREHHRVADRWYDVVVMERFLD
jgi:RimJ/RimL family protein N-acetyltransferase